MCLIAVKNDKTAKFTPQNFRNSMAANPDGFGIMYVDKGRVKVEKMLGTLKDSLSLYYEHMNRPQFILHHRRATHGTKTVENVHPFMVMNKDWGDPYDLAMCHNGVINDKYFSKGADKVQFSDTNLFVQEYLKPLLHKYPDLLDEGPFQVMLHDLIGGYNKLAFLRSDGRIKIFNKDAGGEVDGCWLSNTSSISDPVTKRTSNIYNQNNRGGYGPSNGQYVNMDGDWDFEDDEHWREAWESSTSGAYDKKDSETMSGTDIDTLMEMMDEFAGFSATVLEQKFIDDPLVCFDMMNMLSKKEVSESYMMLAAPVAANSLYVLLQDYVDQKDGPDQQAA